VALATPKHGQNDEHFTPPENDSPGGANPKGPTDISPPLGGPQEGSTEPKSDQPADIGYITGTLRDALTRLGLDSDTAEKISEAAAFAASFYPPVAVALAIDDLQTAIRKNDIPGIAAAVVSLIPGGRPAIKALEFAARTGTKGTGSSKKQNGEKGNGPEPAKPDSTTKPERNRNARKTTTPSPSRGSQKGGRKHRRQAIPEQQLPRNLFRLPSRRLPTRPRIPLQRRD
jgi:hypothetical protein